MSGNGVLFVDDDPGVLSSLRRMLHPMRGAWNMRFAASGAEALEILSKEDFDVIISDMRMPEMNGAQLLAKVKIRHPRVARIILSGHSERELAIQTINVAHQFLNKPSELDELTTVIRRAIALRALLARKEICELANGVVRMPSLPQHYIAINEELQSESPSVERVAQIVEEDPAMTVTVLRLVNSGFFGLGSRINSVMEAIGLLGIELLRNLALATGIFSKFESTPEFSIEDFSLRAIRVASLARQLAAQSHVGKSLVEEVFVSSILCDMGLLVLNTAVPDSYARVRAAAPEYGSLHEAEKLVLGATHAEFGAYMMGIWGFQDDIVEAVACHHTPGLATESKKAGPLLFTHVADALVPPCRANPEPAALDRAYVESLGMGDALSEWQNTAESLISVNP